MEQNKQSNFTGILHYGPKKNELRISDISGKGYKVFLSSFYIGCLKKTLKSKHLDLEELEVILHLDTNCIEIPVNVRINHLTFIGYFTVIIKEAVAL